MSSDFHVLGVTFQSVPESEQDHSVMPVGPGNTAFMQAEPLGLFAFLRTLCACFF